jgi:hypothetical protein
MARSRLTTVLFTIGLLGLGSGATSAQFGGIFGGPPPRPPGSVPGARPSGPPPGNPNDIQQGDLPPGGSPPGGFPQSGLPPAGTAPGNNPSPPRNAAPGGAIQSAPLAPAQANQGQPVPPPLAGLPPGQRQPRGVPQPADAPPAGDDVFAEPPTQKLANTSALFSGLDKITGRIINFDAAIGETVQFGALQVTPRACYTRPATETSNTDAFIEVDEVTLQGEVKRVFTGWMFAASPGLHGVEHPIYDVWLTDCKGAVPTVAAEKAPDPPVAPAPVPARAQPQPKQPQPKQRPPAPQQFIPPQFR